MGQSILESYSRVMESLAFNIMARIDDLLYVDDATKLRTASELGSMPDKGEFTGFLNSFKSPLTIPAFSSSKQKLESPARTYHSVHKSSLWSSFDENLERLTF